MDHKQKQLPDFLESGLRFIYMGSGLRLSHRIQEDLIAFLDELGCTNETVTAVRQIVVNHFHDQMAREILTMKEQLQSYEKIMKNKILSWYETVDTDDEKKAVAERISMGRLPEIR